MGGGEGALGCCEHALGITAEKEEGGNVERNFGSRKCKEEEY